MNCFSFYFLYFYTLFWHQYKSLTKFLHLLSFSFCPFFVMFLFCSIPEQGKVIDKGAWAYGNGSVGKGLDLGSNWCFL